MSGRDSMRPDVDEVLTHLKDFQRDTVDAVFQRLYLDDAPARRFLVADEVGLGKTLVAKGVIAKAVDHLWDTVERIDVIYICSNTDIARQNISRLELRSDANVALASRMTLLPTTLPDIRQNKLNFVAFTPGTSFNLRSSQGISGERVLLYRMLHEAWQLGDRKGPKIMFQGGVHSFKRFANRLRWSEARIDPGIQADYIRALRRQAEDAAARGEPSLEERFDNLARTIVHYKQDHIPGNLLWQRRVLVGELRALLAKVCVRALEPDIIVLDEFQRFRELLHGKNEMGRLARELFDYRDEEAGADARVLLLSATPYKMYTRHHEQEDDHYRDFMATMRFLLENEEGAVADFEGRLEAYRKALYRLGPDSLPAVRTAAKDVEAGLRRVMVRNERLQAHGSINAMLQEMPPATMRLEARDLAAFLGIDRLAHEIGARDHVEYWKSAAYLPNFMDRYVLGRQLVRALDEPDGPPRIAEALRGHPEALLDWEDFEQYRVVDPGNPKLRALFEDAKSSQAWRLLWLPPSLPYYEPAGVFHGPAEAGVTKALVFSAWKMVPKVIATLLSYDVERRMVGDDAASYSYSDLTSKRRALLRFAAVDRSTADGSVVRDLSGMSVLPLLYPCITLAEAIDPLAIAAGLREEGEIPTTETVLERATKITAGLLAELVPPGARDLGGNEDRAWYWSALAQLDGSHHRAPAEAWLAATAEDEHPWSSMLRLRDQEGGVFDEHETRFREHLDGHPDLGRVPEDLAQQVALMALASPAVCALRALRRQWPEGGEAGWEPLIPAAARAAMGFRSLFNLPETITMLRALPFVGDGEEASYWNLTLRYALDGNLQAVLDEYVHILRSSLGQIGRPAEQAAWPIGGEIQRSTSIRSNLLHFDELDCAATTRESMQIRHRLRCRYAMGFGLEAEDTEGDRSRDELVRGAFNSPFRPFVLASTSIGQEGLDFHWYCHRVYHWNLPSNPVDLEQREGRVNRYKGHAIRRNVAERHAEAAWAQHGGAAGGGGSEFSGNGKDNGRRHPNGGGGDPWDGLFDAAHRRPERNANASDLDPFWIFEDGPARVERHVPTLPLSRDRAFLSQLKQSLVAYRLVFGQPRQEDLMDFLTQTLGLEGAFLDEVLGACRIDLSAGES